MEAKEQIWKKQSKFFPKLRAENNQLCEEVARLKREKVSFLHSIHRQRVDELHNELTATMLERNEEGGKCAHTASVFLSYDVLYCGKCLGRIFNGRGQHDIIVMSPYFTVLQVVKHFPQLKQRGVKMPRP